MSSALNSGSAPDPDMECGVVGDAVGVPQWVFERAIDHSVLQRVICEGVVNAKTVVRLVVLPRLVGILPHLWMPVAPQVGVSRLGEPVQ